MAKAILNGIGTVMTGVAEMLEADLIEKEWRERSTRHTPGTHTLGKEYATVDQDKTKKKHKKTVKVDIA